MSKLFVRTLQDGQVPSAELLNDIFIDTILKNYNGGISGYNLAGLSDMNASKLLDASIKSRTLKLTQGVIRSTDDLTLTSSYQDVPGVTVTINADVDSTVYLIGFFTLSGVVLADTDIIGVLDLDGVNQTGEATCNNTDTHNRRITIGQIWTADIDTNTHVFKLRIKKSAGASTSKCTKIGTALYYRVYSQ